MPVGIKKSVNLQNVTVLMYKDDMVLLSSNTADLQTAFNSVKTWVLENSMVTSGSNTKTRSCGKN
jgi:hypothetical protein